MRNIIKRNGSEAAFDPEKILKAIQKANSSVDEFDRASRGDAEAVAKRGGVGRLYRTCSWR